MSLSRRKFMKVGAVAVVCAALPLKSVMAQKGKKGGAPVQELPPSTSLEQLNYYSESSFSPYLNTEFRVHLDESNTRGLKLVEVTDYLSTLSRRATKGYSPDNECFSLLLTIPQGNPFEQDTYLIEHVALGSFYMFVVPVSREGRRPLDYYEAIIYRRGERYPKGYDTTSSSRAEGLFSQKSAVEGLEVATQSGMGQPKTEKEIFYFRPRKADPSATTKTSDPGAAGRLAASRLTVDQAPNISGLKLGMTMEQVLALFPGIKNDAEVRPSLTRPISKLGVQSLVVKPRKYSTNRGFDHISQITVTFLDGRVSTLNVSFDGPVWKHVDEFVTKFAAETGLPGAESWVASVGMDTQLKTLKGRDFTVSLFAGGSNVNMNYVQLRDLTALQQLKERNAKAEKTKGE